jgi:hypothetical protein
MDKGSGQNEKNQHVSTLWGGGGFGQCWLFFFQDLLVVGGGGGKANVGTEIDKIVNLKLKRINRDFLCFND